MREVGCLAPSGLPGVLGIARTYGTQGLLDTWRHKYLGE